MKKISLEEANVLLEERGLKIKLTSQEEFEIYQKRERTYHMDDVEDFLEDMKDWINETVLKKIPNLSEKLFKKATTMYENSGELTFYQCVNWAYNEIIREIPNKY